MTFVSVRSCRPREGCGLHLYIKIDPDQMAQMVAVPARGAGCIAEKELANAITDGIVAVPARGAGCISKAVQPV